ncbi:MAG TPA: long-chain fatty acid--CoA ligase, partial [Bacteroidetes bacterium]|nr:long-chain fatty acid--CoA ligase [Bacteroidota bacterium]
MLKENFIEYLENAIQNTWDGNAFSDYNGKTMTYREVAGQILKFHLFFEKAGIKKGDKIALLGKNSTNWG